MKTLGLIITGIFCAHMVTAQDNQVRVQNSENLSDKDYTTFYFLDDSESGEAQANNQDYNQTTDGEETFQSTDQNQMGEETVMDYEKKEKMKDKSHMKDEAHMMKDKAHTSFDSDKSDKKAVKTAIIHEMVSRGYEIDPENPDLLVTYKVFDESTELTDFTDDNQTGIAANTNIDQRESVEVGKGTLLITVTDSEDGTMISRGFLSEALETEKDKDFDTSTGNMENMSEDENYHAQVKVIQAVSGIFDQLQFESATLGAGR